MNNEATPGQSITSNQFRLKVCSTETSGGNRIPYILGHSKLTTTSEMSHSHVKFTAQGPQKATDL